MPVKRLEKGNDYKRWIFSVKSCEYKVVPEARINVFHVQRRDYILFNQHIQGIIYKLTKY
jgi:hypothetical protein